MSASSALDPLARFGPATQAWFRAAFPAPTPVQVDGWDHISRGQHALLLAPTGSGKTLAAFLWCLDRLALQPPPADGGVRVLYVSPIKALAYDVDRNLRTPLAGIAAAAARLGLPAPDIAVSVRTGDTPADQRRAFQRRPGQVLVTTPESLYLLLSSQARGALAAVETVIVDEIHAVAGTKRGVHLALTLERLHELVTRPDDAGRARPAPQRIGLSATQRPLEEIAAFLGGLDDAGQPRPVAIVDRAARPAVDLQIVVPVDDMESPGPPPAPALPGVDAVLDDLPALVGPPVPAHSSLPGDRSGIWPAIHPRLLQLITAHRSTILFCNSRRLCERLAQRLNELAAEAGLPVPLVRAHHGSVSHAERAAIEEQLKAGVLPGIVATSSLELGIDMGAVDLVILVESPGAVSRGLQRVGRAGHQVGQTSKGRIFPKYRGDLLEAAVVVQQMEAGEIEETRVPTNCLDVLAQQLVSACLEREWAVAGLGALVRRAWPYRTLGEGALHATLEMLAGRAGGQGRDELRPRLTWDRTRDTVQARRDARLAVFGTPGTIPDRGLYGVYLAGEAAGEGQGGDRRKARGRRLGELDEEMVYESRRGDVVILGASSWRIVEIQRDRVLVEPAPGQPGRLPFWRGEGPGRPIGLGRALGAFTRRLDGMPGPQARAWLVERCHLDDRAAGNLLAWLADQRAATGTLPTDRAITVERFRDELGDWRICILTPFGAQVHAPWALALEALLGRPAGQGEARTGVQSIWTDDGIVLRFPDADLIAMDGGDPQGALPDAAALVPDPDEVEELITHQLRHSAVYAARFREAATRALLLGQRRPGQRAPLWAQRLSAQRLLALAEQLPAFPIVLETYRECLRDVFDVPALVELLRQVRDRTIRVDEVQTDGPSPFARGLVYAYVAEFLYEGDAPLAERRAQALALDRGLLRELLGEEELRDLLDPAVMDEVEAELQGLAPDRRARSADGLWDLLRRVGELPPDQLGSRVQADDPPDAARRAAAWLDELARQRRVGRIRVAGQERVIVLDDAARYRDALGCPPPAGTPAALLEPVPDALAGLVRRHARTHGPFTAAALGQRLGMTAGQVLPVLELLRGRGVLVQGALRPGGQGAADWCDAEVLRRIKRRTLAKLRGEVAAVDGAALARFTVDWQGVLVGPARRRSAGRAAVLLDEAVVQLEGCALPWSELERRVLPARVPGYRPELLDQLGVSGAILWLGAGRLSARDGRVALYRREQVPLLVEPPPPVEELVERGLLPWSPVHAAALAWLEERGASFTVELQQAVARGVGAPLRADELQAALWDLAWAGLVTNDTFHPLRALAGPARRRTAGVRGGRLGGPLAGGGGRWAAVRWLLGGGPEATRAAHARAVMLLDRYGVIAAAHARAEELRGGFSAVYEVLRGMEEAGKLRRGHLVDGLDGAQFALPGAVDRLRGCREQPELDGEAPGAGTLVLAATDPAAPWGLALPWPSPGGTATPRRAAGASVVVVAGQLALHLEAGGRSASSFGPLLQPELALRATAALRAHRAELGEGSLRLERLDGVAAPAADAAAALLAAGWRHEGDQLVLDGVL